MTNERPSALRFYAPDNPRLVVTMRAKLEKLRAEYLENLVLRQNADLYNRTAGIVEGIDAALQLCVDAETELRDR